LDVSRLLTAR